MRFLSVGFFIKKLFLVPLEVLWFDLNFCQRFTKICIGQKVGSAVYDTSGNSDSAVYLTPQCGKSAEYLTPRS